MTFNCTHAALHRLVSKRSARMHAHTVFNLLNLSLFVQAAFVCPHQVDDAEWSQLAAADYHSAASLQGLPLAERWVLSRLHQTIDRVTDRFEKFDFSEAGRLTYEFLWDEFADWFIEAAKSRLYGKDEAAAAATRGVLVYVFDKVLKLLHPFMPFISEEMWQVGRRGRQLHVLYTRPIPAVQLPHFMFLTLQVH